MLNIVKTENGYNVYDDDKQKNILKYDYDNIDIQKYGIVATKNTKGTFLDRDFHLYNKNGKFLFSVHEHYNGNYVVSHSFHFYEKYICVNSSCTADYDKWDHGTSYSHSYYHLDGKPFNIGDYCVDEIDEHDGDIYVLDVSKGLWSSDTVRDTFFYDMKNRKVVLSKSALLKDVKNLVNAIDYHMENKLRSMLAEEIKKQEFDAMLKHNLSEKEKTLYNNDINKRLSRFMKNGGFIDLYGDEITYDENNLRIPEYDNLRKAYRDIDHLGHWASELKTDYGYSFYYNYENDCYNVSISLKRTKIKDIFSEVDKLMYGRNDYIDLTLMTINPNTMEISINTRTLNRLKNLYTKLTGKPCPALNIEKLDYKQIQEDELCKQN